MGRGIFLLYFEGYLQELELKGLITQRQANIIRGYYRLADNPRNVPFLDGFVEYILNTPPDEVVIRDAGRENNAKTFP